MVYIWYQLYNEDQQKYWSYYQTRPRLVSFLPLCQTFQDLHPQCTYKMAPTIKANKSTSHTPYIIAVVIGVVGLVLIFTLKLTFARRRRHLQAVLQHSRERQSSQPSVRPPTLYVSQYHPLQANRAASKYCHWSNSSTIWKSYVSNLKRQLALQPNHFDLQLHLLKLQETDPTRPTSPKKHLPYCLQVLPAVFQICLPLRMHQWYAKCIHNYFSLMELMLPYKVRSQLPYRLMLRLIFSRLIMSMLSYAATSNYRIRIQRTHVPQQGAVSRFTILCGRILLFQTKITAVSWNLSHVPCYPRYRR